MKRELALVVVLGFCFMNVLCRSSLSSAKSRLANLRGNLSIIKETGLEDAAVPQKSVVAHVDSSTFDYPHTQSAVKIKIPANLAGAFALLNFFILFLVSSVRSVNGITITAIMGDTAVSTLKFVGILPAAALFTSLFIRFSQRMDAESLLSRTMAYFAFTFALFGTTLFPGYATLQSFLPDRFILTMDPVQTIMKNWLLSIFSIHAELWSTVGASLVFWLLANDVFDLQSAARFYPAFVLTGNVGSLVGRGVLDFANDVAKAMIPIEGKSHQELTMQIMGGLWGVTGLILVFLHSYIRRLHKQEVSNVLDQAAYEQRMRKVVHNAMHLPPTAVIPEEQTAYQTPPHGFIPNQAKPLKLRSLTDIVRLVMTHKPLRRILRMVLSYEIAIHASELVWKGLLRPCFANEADYLLLITQYNTFVTYATGGLALVGRYMLHRQGWKYAAMFSPVLTILLAAPFFFTAIMAGIPSLMTSQYLRHLTPKIIMTGFLLHGIAKASEYAIFDPVKEMAYIPLDPQSKTHGKAAIDVLGARLGKSAGALLQQLVVVGAGGAAEGAPLIAVAFFSLVGLWIDAVQQQSPMLDRLIDRTPMNSTRDIPPSTATVVEMSMSAE